MLFSLSAWPSPVPPDGHRTSGTPWNRWAPQLAKRATIAGRRACSPRHSRSSRMTTKAEVLPTVLGVLGRLPPNMVAPRKMPGCSGQRRHSRAARLRGTTPSGRARPSRSRHGSGQRGDLAGCVRGCLGGGASAPIGGGHRRSIRRGRGSQHRFANEIRAGGPDASRTGGIAPTRRWLLRPRDRRNPLHQPPYSRQPCQQYPRQARCSLPRRRGSLGRSQRVGLT